MLSPNHPLGFPTSSRIPLEDSLANQFVYGDPPASHFGPIASANTFSNNANLNQIFTEFGFWSDIQLHNIREMENYFNRTELHKEVRQIYDDASKIVNCNVLNNIGFISESLVFEKFCKERKHPSFLSILLQNKLINVAEPSGLENTTKSAPDEAETTSDSAFAIPPKTIKRKLSISDANPIPTKNRFQTLTDELEENETIMDITQNAEQTDSPTQNKKDIIHPFYIEYGEINWNEIAKEIKKLEPEPPPPIVKLANENLIKVQCKTLENFRATQNYLDVKGHKYTTIPPKEQRPKKVCIRGIPPNTDPQLIIDDLKKHGFIASRAAMMKSKITGRGMPLYMVNVLPQSNFEDIYKIDELCDIGVTVERFTNNNNPKQCYRCLNFGHASEICKLSPRCCKCAGPHWTKECPTPGFITPKCALCGLQHPATYRGCSKNPMNNNKQANTAAKNNPRTNNGSIRHTNNNSKTNNLKDIAEVFKSYNYTANKSTENTQTPAQTPKNDDTLPIGNTDTDFPALTPKNSTENKKTHKANKTNSQENDLSSGLTDIFKICNDMKEMLQITKLIQCIRNIASINSKLTDPWEKMKTVMIEFDKFATQLNLTENE